ncbi:MAG: hypothetical protein HOK06_06925 [Rhodospirillaceae bacterium]|jgi:hypothetical protein|nr:hypothetical protein [Rhodospirillaceae bacterium]MBT5308709.1 hypothetical protein [Rhodospirillaceae bacterium]MBT6407320.1 hypothetical protein [Rhodospirillaceae bacterium]MBT7356648.1 hypothetical protein [Rhodospirillaceae bacterium]
MNELLGLDANFPLFHLIPLIVFGPIFALVLYHIGLKEIFNPSPEVRERRRLRKEAEERTETDLLRKMKVAGLDRSGMSRTPLQWIGQALTFGIFALAISWLSSSPAYVVNPSDMALIKLSLTHPGQRKEACRKMTQAELQKLAVNMRSGVSCSRERWPLRAELIVDGELVFRGSANPAGLASDGHSSFYKKFPVPAGPHHIVFRLNDSGGEGFDYMVDKKVVLTAAQILVVSFDNGVGKPVFAE